MNPIGALLVGCLTQLAAAEPQAAAVSGTPLWLVGVEGWAFVVDERLQVSPLTAELHQCLGDGVVTELSTLAGGRGAMAYGFTACAVSSAGVSNEHDLRLPIDWREYAVSRSASPFLTRLRKSGLLTELTQRARHRSREWEAAQSPVVEVPGCHCALVSRQAGLVVLVDGGVDDRATDELQKSLGAKHGDTFTLEPGDGGVHLSRPWSTYSGGCPAGDEFVDELDVRWNPKTRSLVAPRLPEYEKHDNTPVHRKVPLVFEQLPSDGGTIDVPASPLTLTSDFTVLSAGKIDRVNTRALRELIRQRCLDWPVFEAEGDALRSVDDASSYVTRCGGEIVSCALHVEYVPAQGRLREAPPLTCEQLALHLLERNEVGADGQTAESQARWCVQQAPSSGLARYTLALVLKSKGAEWERAHLEAALELGLPAKEKADALHRLGR